MKDSQNTNSTPNPSSEQLEALIAAINRLADTIEQVRPFLADLSESMLIEGKTK